MAKVKVIKRGNKVTKSTKDIFDTKHREPGYAIDTSVFDNVCYILAFPLRWKIEKEDNYYVIQSEMIDMVGTGKI